MFEVLPNGLLLSRIPGASGVLSGRQCGSICRFPENLKTASTAWEGLRLGAVLIRPLGLSVLHSWKELPPRASGPRKGRGEERARAH